MKELKERLVLDTDIDMVQPPARAGDFLAVIFVELVSRAPNDQVSGCCILPGTP
jgi:hypothetical protein